MHSSPHGMTMTLQGEGHMFSEVDVGKYWLIFFYQYSNIPDV